MPSGHPRSYAINTSRVETSPDDHHGRRILVPRTDQPADVAEIGPLGQFQAVLGSRTAPRTIHRRISGLVASLAIDTLLAADLPRQSRPLVGELRRYGETRATPQERTGHRNRLGSE